MDERQLVRELGQSVRTRNSGALLRCNSFGSILRAVRRPITGGATDKSAEDGVVHEINAAVEIKVGAFARTPWLG